jgi:hypothetical protein
MDVQALLFDRSAGWTPSKAKEWAKSHGYKYGKVHVTDQFVRLRQFDPKGFKVKRTIPFGRGIKAVVAREGVSMRTREARRRTKRTSAAEAPKRTARRTRAAEAPKRTARHTAAAEAPRRRGRAAEVTEARRRRRRRKTSEARRRRSAAPMMMEARRRPRRRRASEAWYGESKRHAKAARKGWRGRKRRRVREPGVMAEARRRPRRRRRASEYNYVMAPRRRRYTREAPGKRGMQMAKLALAVVSGGFGFVLADGVDRWLATYDPAATEKPKDKFTSDGSGTLGNTLNVASPPTFLRIAAGLGTTALPAVAAAFVRNPYLQSSLEGAAIGAGVSLFKTLWNNLLMPALKPKDTSAASLQKSFIARLYPAEIAASINLEQKMTAMSSATTGALSGPPQQAGVGAHADVGPFALAAESPYPDAAQALRQQAGMQGPGGDYPTVQNVWGTGAQSTPGVPPGIAEYPTAAQALTQQTGQVGAWAPGPPPGTGPGPQARPHDNGAECACLGDENPFLGFVGDAEEKDTLYNMPS